MSGDWRPNCALCLAALPRLYILRQLLPVLPFPRKQYIEMICQDGARGRIGIAGGSNSSLPPLPVPSEVIQNGEIEEAVRLRHGHARPMVDDRGHSVGGARIGDDPDMAR